LILNSLGSTHGISWFPPGFDTKCESCIIKKNGIEITIGKISPRQRQQLPSNGSIESASDYFGDLFSVVEALPIES
jgi:hypothetical protein